MIDRLQRRLEEIGAPDDVKALAVELAEQAVHDSLTGLYNRRFFDEALAQSIEAARRYKRSLSLILFDLDCLKELNDAAGHQAGDCALKTFSAGLSQTARASDIVCRIGGDEFAVILPETEFSNVRNFTDRFFLTLEKQPLDFPDVGTKHSSPWKLSASFGAAALPSENLFSAADAVLLQNKENRKIS